MQAALLKPVQYMVKRFFETIPQNYFRLTIQGTLVSVTRFHGQQGMAHAEMTLRDAQFQDLNTLLNRFPSYPVYCVLKDEEFRFLMISLKAARVWNKQALLKRAKEGEFLKTSWVQTQLMPSTKDADRYLLTGVSPSAPLKALIDNLKNLSNPFVGVQVWPIVFADHVFKTLEKQRNPANSAEWVMILYKNTSNNWHLIVCHHQAVILNRKGRFTPESAVNLTQEITSTMRYLNRHQYQQGDPVTLIQIGFEKTVTFIKFPCLNVIDLKDTFTETLPIVSPFQVPELRAHHLAFAGPQKLVKAAIPLGFGLLMASGILFLNTYFHQQTHSFLLQQYLNLKPPSESSANIRLSHLFHVYQSIQSPNPLELLQHLSKILPPYALVTDVCWIAQNLKTSVSELNLTLAINKQFLNTKNRADFIGKRLRLYKEKVQRAFYKSSPTSQISWGPLSRDFGCTLKITYPSKKSL